MTLTYRSVKGSALTAAELDGNTTDLNGRIATLETDPPSAISIDHFEVAGAQFYVHMTDSSVLGPYNLPAIRWNFRGAWAPAETLLANDTFTVGSKVYETLVSHVTAASFDPGANDGMGHDYYGLLLDVGLTFSVSQDNGNDSLAADTSATLTLAMAGAYIRCTSVTGTVVTVPDDATLDFPIDTEIQFRQCVADAPIVFVPESTGVLIDQPEGFDTATSARGAVVFLKKVGANAWDLGGRLAAVSA
ncbi:MAG: hypothetical protein JWL86_5421 [Rhizobium sp.]|nr:hypothetical protein [Rhizobium sp.]